MEGKKWKHRAWSKEETFKLIELYREFPSLWDSKSENFKNRALLKGALGAMAIQFDTTPDEVRRKIHNLNTQFCQEVKKIRKRRNPLSSKGIYHCKWEYFDALKFTKWASRLKKHGRKSESNEDDEDTKITVANEGEPLIQGPLPKKHAPRTKNLCKGGRKRKKRFPLEIQDIVTPICPVTSRTKERMILSDVPKPITTACVISTPNVEETAAEVAKTSRNFGNDNISSSATPTTVHACREECQQCENLVSQNNSNVPQPDMPVTVTSFTPLNEESKDAVGENAPSNRTAIPNATTTTSYVSSTLNVDESQDFGNLTAKKLRKYDVVTQSAIQNAIMGVFLNADLGIYEHTRHSMSAAPSTQAPSYTRSVDYLRHAQNLYSSGHHPNSSVQPSPMTITSTLSSLNFPTNFSHLDSTSDDAFRAN